MRSIEFTSFPKLSYEVTEAINTLCTNLTFTGRNYKKIMITSVTEAEGKSFLAMEIFRKMAELGKSIILVDADLRRSKISVRYGVQYSTSSDLGITHYLAGKCTLEDILYSTNLRRAYYIPVGYYVSNSLALISSPKFRDLLDQLAMQADYVLVDGPPIGMIVDAAEIAKSCDGAVFAVSYNRVHRSDLFEAEKQIERSGCAVLGAVLNNVPMNVYNSRKYKGIYGKYRKMYTPDTRPGGDDDTDDQKANTR
ncbi:MAG TPA: CpsD/CapB family tyrosine-protein kinase [Candidatus Limiplasma sp.]|nr:CpsD/CapB family tyrosine-protein kinase [Candidatus Limiplasma sp.]HRX08565.1 CpsD/CapB family tyrosine-protein kinase [Candidatus Limiplasma sp.]